MDPPRYGRLSPFLRPRTCFRQGVVSQRPSSFWKRTRTDFQVLRAELGQRNAQRASALGRLTAAPFRLLRQAALPAAYVYSLFFLVRHHSLEGTDPAESFGLLVLLGSALADPAPAAYRRRSLRRPSWRSHLGGGFVLRCFQHLSLPDADTRRCTWRHNRQTGGLSNTVLSY